MAAQNGRVGVVEVLADLGVEIDAKDKWGNTALDLASMYGLADTARFLAKELGADRSAVIAGVAR